MAAGLRSRKHTYSSSSYTIAACSSLVDMRQNTHLLSVDEALVSFVSTTSGPLSLAIGLCERAREGLSKLRPLLLPATDIH